MVSGEKAAKPGGHFRGRYLAWFGLVFEWADLVNGLRFLISFPKEVKKPERGT